MTIATTHIGSARVGRTTDLLHRNSGGVDVTLLWNHDTGSVTLELIDRCQNCVTELSVRPDRASYAFHHPFAYQYERLLSAPQLAA